MSEFTNLARTACFWLVHDRLALLARKALTRGLALDDFMIVNIEVDDPVFRQIVDILMPDEDWEAIRAVEDPPFARGSVVRAGMVKIVSKLIPDLASVLQTGPTDGFAHALVLAFGGGSVFNLLPAEPQV